jgi:hypothetical protein
MLVEQVGNRTRSFETEQAMSSQELSIDSNIVVLTATTSSGSDAALHVNDIPLSQDIFKAVLQRAKRDREVFLQSLLIRLLSHR